MNIESQLNTIFQDIFDNKDIRIHSKMTAKDLEGWDSLNHINLIVSIETAFKIRFTTKEINGFNQVGDIISAISNKIS